MKLSRVHLFESLLLILLSWVIITSLMPPMKYSGITSCILLLATALMAVMRNTFTANSQYKLTVAVAVAAIGAALPALGVSYAYVIENSSPLLAASIVTLYISFLAICLACVMALVAAMARISNRPVLSGVADVYISFFRGTPLLLQVFIIYLGLPQVGIVLSAIPAAVLALGLNYGAYMAEIVRAGIQGIPRGQTEASLSLGLTRFQTFFLVVAPQALRLVLPPISNQFIAMLKDSSLVSFLGVWELMFVARTAGRADLRQFEMLIGAALVYCLMSFCFEVAQRTLEHKMGCCEERTPRAMSGA